MNNSMNIIYENEYFIFYLSGENNTNIHLDSKSKEIQEKYDDEEVMSHEEKLKKVDELLEYFYNFWKFIEKSCDKKIYTMYFNINLVMINMPSGYFIKIKNTLDSLKSVIISNLKESYFKVENKLAKYFINLILTFYKPIKPVHLT
uniref:Uncharacterized protein n=1 Tax=viral metagenome TaxID=1070528 RepID=A0A6C0LG81_9ZZZZ